jgi:thiol-disulfide isomerase/thioredoxin
VVFFWSLFCQPCREEFGRLAELAARPPVPGLKVLAVNVDSPKLRPQASRFFASQRSGITGVYDRQLEGGRFAVAELFGVNATPSTFLVGPDGAVLEAWSGEVANETLVAAIVARFAAGAVRP